ncbi:anti-phage ZorAB system protein ZorA [Citrifermentans bremense]|uniref:anti-phage ZorAB system protein ZorA n=1 Tax=Citrifermentans bremense TaxID=60035 RepID=UPI0004131D7D|nr:anti-phage ZorAB system protein ZorA [Citrifermentans bremense]
MTWQSALHLMVIGVTGTYLVLFGRDFWRRFLVPGRKLKTDLSNSVEGLRLLKGKTTGPLTELEKVAQEAMETEALSHAWSEFCETLHPQKKTNELGQDYVICWRSTALAESFFTEKALVDTPLHAEYFKHVPGILTGIGIIGTFAGLILGLMNFQVSSNAEIVRGSLTGLIHGVGYSFLVSFVAIFMAMTITKMEKAMVNDCYRQVEKLCQLIDSLFNAGAGEEYLARLVSASETSATQAAQIKDALVADLKQILSELTAQQVEAAAQHSTQLSATLTRSFSESITESITAPMERISQAVSVVGGNQGEAVNKLLTDVLAGFAAKMEDMFGGQLQGMTTLLQQTSQSMISASSQFGQMAETLKSAGEGAADAMAERLTQTIQAMEARQETMNRQMGEFVEQIRALVRDSQSETSQKMQTVLGELGEKVSSMVTQLEAQSRQTAEESRDVQQQFVAQTSTTVEGISGQLMTLVQEVKHSGEAMRDSVGTLAQTNRDSIERLNSGAETLYLAATEFAKAGQGVTSVMTSATRATEKIQETSLLLSGASAGVQQVLEDYKHARESFAAIVADLKSTVENARREASMTGEVISRIHTAAEHLGRAQTDADEYLLGVSEVLGKSHEEFAQNITRTLREGNSQFHTDLSGAVDLLKSAILDLGDTVDSIKR